MNDIKDLTQQELLLINGGSWLSDTIVEWISSCIAGNRTVPASTAKGNYNGTYWNCGMHSTI
jgi:hypothetical protein